ncbi:MAG: ChpI protein [Candidatus Delongbacteria bacterium]|nr:ChpI protein [Candidatus Delongbacteria bacterium]
MKTAISIPDNVYNEAEITAKQLGVARSQLYVMAIKEFIEHHNKDKITEKLNLVLYNQNPKNDFNDVGLDTLRKATGNDTW